MNIKIKEETTEEQGRGEVQKKIDRIKFLFDHDVYFFPYESKERKELNQAIMDILNKIQSEGPVTWQPILPLNSEPVKIYDIFSLLYYTKTNGWSFPP